MRKLIEGIVEFREKHLAAYAERFRGLAAGQNPDTLFIACSDSRVVPDLLVSTDPGELFMMRNVGNLVPRAAESGRSTGDVSEASAIEYALLALGVRNIVVCGHSGCGAMKAALSGKAVEGAPNLERWLSNAQAARERLERDGAHDPSLGRDDQLSQMNVLVQLENLMSYPLVRERVAAGTLFLGGCWFRIATGDMYAYERPTDTFEVIDRAEAERLHARIR
jgi:carbonic anhydrase